MSSFTKFDATASVQYDAEASQSIGKDLWKVSPGFSFFTGEIENQEWIVVHDGFVTDGATVPRIFWSFIPPWGQYGQAAIVHDYLCVGGLIVVCSENKPNVGRIPKSSEIDKIFLEAMTVLQVPKWNRYTMYLAVRLFRAWKGFI